MAKNSNMALECFHRIEDFKGLESLIDPIHEGDPILESESWRGLSFATPSYYLPVLTKCHPIVVPTRPHRMPPHRGTYPSSLGDAILPSRRGSVSVDQCLQHDQQDATVFGTD